MHKGKAIVSSLSLVISLSLYFTPASFAEVKPSPSPTSTLSPTQIYINNMQAFKKDIKSYELVVKEYERGLRKISIEFMQAIIKAGEDSKLLGRSAASKASHSAACAAAAKIRDEAVASLGPEPEPPIAPLSPLKASTSKSATTSPSKSKNN